MRPVITLLTDFGLEDGYVAAMKAVMLRICPEVLFVDITHSIPPQNVRSGAFVLETVVRDFPAGTVHLAVVDPGVGTERLPIAVKAADSFFVGPDNGLFSWILGNEPNWQARILVDSRFRRPAASSSFHGRDIFAPAAAHLARGVSFQELGPVCRPRIEPWFAIQRERDGLSGQVVHVDRFGNVVTNIHRNHLPEALTRSDYTLQVGPAIIERMVRTYGEAPPGVPVALVGSSGYLEIAVNQGNAAELLGLVEGQPVRVRFRYLDPPR
jgi:S-adenosylmethionine hydrolase